MARITIVPSDGIMIVDGVARDIDMTGIDPTIHAVQWQGTRGEIEYNDTKSHEQIDDITPFDSFLALWTAAVPPIPKPKSAGSLSAEELADQMIVDGTMTRAKVDAIKAAR